MGSKELEVLLVHRPRWEDWSFPKGKLERGEASYTAAVREVEEETSLRVGLGPSLPDTHYTVSGGQPKVVHYWCAKAPKDNDISSYRPNNEIDDVRWVAADKALRRLSYPYDSNLLETFLTRPFDTAPLIVVRHTHARQRKTWKGEDAERPLRAQGKEEAHKLVGLFAAYGVSRVISSPALRCVDTVLPYINAHQAKFRLDPRLSEDGFDLSEVQQRVRRELDRDKPVVICSHRPVLPDIQRALGLEPVALDPGALVVAHRRNGKVHEVEQHPTP
jgi:8-oxo-dGTP pyrophosphatase MutT (NUDIX family)/phosphohistidine phosphatase SixA